MVRIIIAGGERLQPSPQKVSDVGCSAEEPMGRTGLSAGANGNRTVGLHQAERDGNLRSG
jgi:hypothetical protein